jgi:hypothetical protein
MFQHLNSAILPECPSFVQLRREGGQRRMVPASLTPDADADADADADVAPGEPSQKGELCVCIGNGVPDSCTITINMIVFKLVLGKVILCAGAEDATVPWMFTSCVQFCLLTRCLRGECAPPPAWLHHPWQGSPSRMPRRARHAHQSI